MAQVSRAWRVKLWFSSWLWTKMPTQKQGEIKIRERCVQRIRALFCFTTSVLGQIPPLSGPQFFHLYNGRGILTCSSNVEILCIRGET